MSTSSKLVMRFGALRRELAIKFQQVGVWGTCRLAALKMIRKLAKLASFRAQELHPFDIKYGTDTSSIVEVGNLDLADDRLKHAVRYQTAIMEVFLAMLSNLPIAYEDFVFIDLGSGKGRALLLASRHPFSAIIGVELSPTLNGVATSNIEKYNEELQRCQRIRSICADAGSFKLPLENLVLYLFNPFDDVVMREVADNIETSLLEKSRAIYVLYLKPEHRYIWDNMRSFERFKETTDYVIYRTHPTAS